MKKKHIEALAEAGRMFEQLGKLLQDIDSKPGQMTMALDEVPDGSTVNYYETLTPAGVVNAKSMAEAVLDSHKSNEKNREFAKGILWHIDAKNLSQKQFLSLKNTYDRMHGAKR